MQIPAMNPLARTIVVLLMAASFSSIPAQAAGPVKVRVPDVDLPFGLDKLPPGLLRNQLKELPANARGNAERWLNSIHFNPQDVPFMRADKDGGIFFVDSYLPTGTLADMPVVEAAAEMLSVEDVFSLHSKRGASKVIHLDFDGHVITNTAWNSEVSSLAALPYDLDNNPNSFNETEIAYMAEIWRRVAEDYAPFDVDVTTEAPATFGPSTGRLLITKNVDANGYDMPAPTAGGVA